MRQSRHSTSKKTRPIIGLLACVAVSVVTLELLLLQKLSDRDFFDSTLKISHPDEHLSPNNLFGNKKLLGVGDKNNVPRDAKQNKRPTPATPTDAQLKLIQTAKKRGLQNVDDKGPILEILSQAGIKIEKEEHLDQKTLDSLPSWTQVQTLYGREPKIYGLERCEEFRNAVEPTTRFFAVAGTFNTGTNLIHDMMHYNCQITERMEVYGEKSKGVRWQVPWGKHMMASYRESDQTTKTDKDVPREHVLPLVSIRDPYSWMQSMCRHHYTANWPLVADHCPNLIATEAEIKGNRKLHSLYGSADESQEKLVPVRVVYKKVAGIAHDHLSLAHFYSEWYRQYMDVDYPRIIVRFEDLLFHGEQVVRTLCDCGGGVPRMDNGRSGAFAHVSESAKKGAAAHGPMAARTNLVGALIRYGSFANRTDTMTHEDLMAARSHFDPKIMDTFGYFHPSLEDVANGGE
eukprot:CAMPEP_0116125128 /NCGR_PEP_ID=MMETSP0329-20121206/5645_1 /TAXON_ID=697910 /ORGANISM="Pseudo-nitzschia arenysensis, Strain B593" /LENGTH=458 /DNA_ID=CAMNT_0003619147 /DNA_START=118 /DNA_END=1494 /DNA_ORIENTATION=-